MSVNGQVKGDWHTIIPMDYKLTNADEIIDIWLFFFEALSVQQFNWMIDDLKFPFEIPEDLRSLAQDFVIACNQYLKKPISFEPSILLYNPDSHTDPLLSIWQNMFSHLEKDGYATDILGWVNQYHDRLLRRKFVIQPISHWDCLLEDWANMPDDAGFLPLQLSDHTVTSLQLLILRSLVHQYKLRTNIDRMKHSLSKNQWEQYAFEQLHVHTWFNLQIRFLTHLERWKSVFTLLSDEEIEIIEEWGWRQFKTIGLNYRESLSKFKIDLNKRNSL